MKLIQILALATAMATMATAQNYLPQQAKVGLAGGPTSASGNGEQSGGASPTPTATPAATKAKSTKTTPAKGAKAAAKPGAATKTTTSTKAAANPASKPAVTAQGGDATVAKGKTVVVKTTAGPVKSQTGAATTSQTKGKATAAPVVAAKPVTATPAAKADAKKTTAKKTDAAKPQAKIAMKPGQGAAAKTGQGAAAKKAGPAQAKAIATPAPKVTQAETAKPAEKPKPVTRSYGARGRRDPFVSPIRAGQGNTPSPSCTTGKRCLAIPELVLQGTVKDVTGKMMAVVANSTKHTYFLRENDQVFNGSVEKITSDSVIFREFTKDAMGRETAREVVKKLVPIS